ncbi:MAG TPA: hypothetical protein VF765_06345 [Polyangiaceae bacterium]
MAQGEELPSGPALAFDDEPEDDPSSSVDEDSSSDKAEEAAPESAEALPPAPGEEILFDEAITRVIRAVLREVGIPDHELENLVDEVRMLTLISGRRKAKNGEILGEETKRWKGLARNTARNFGLNWREKEKTRKEGMIKLAADAHSVAPARSVGGMDPLDQKKALDVYQRMKRHPNADDMVDATRTGEGPSEAARQEGLPPKQGHKILGKTRERYAEALRYAKLAVLFPTATVAVGMALLFARGTSLWPWDIENRYHPPAHLEHGKVAKELGGWDDPDSLRLRVAQLREQAAAECKAHQDQQCKDDMALADFLDPDRGAGGSPSPHTSAKPGWP